MKGRRGRTRDDEWDHQPGRRCLRMPPNRHPEPGVQVGEGSLTLGSSDARRSRSSGDVPSPCSVSIGSRKYKARQHRRPLHCRRLAIALQEDRQYRGGRSGQVAGACPSSSPWGITPVRVARGGSAPRSDGLTQLEVSYNNCPSCPRAWSSRPSKLCRRNVSSSVGATAEMGAAAGAGCAAAWAAAASRSATSKARFNAANTAMRSRARTLPASRIRVMAVSTRSTASSKRDSCPSGQASR